MAITKANVIDIRNIDINSMDKSKIFALDTNALYWMHYSRCTLARSIGSQLSDYPNFISDLVSNGNKLVTSIYNITELIYIIERNEYDIYKLSDHSVGKKDFRNIITARTNVKSELEAVIMQIKQLYDIKEFNIDILGIDDFLNDFTNHNCDDFDFLIVKNLVKNGVKNIISDDSDLATLSDIVIYTANQNIVDKAVAANLLLK